MTDPQGEYNAMDIVEVLGVGKVGDLKTTPSPAAGEALFLPRKKAEKAGTC